MTFSYLSVCDGISAVGEAWGPLGARPVLLSEIDAFPREVLKLRHGAEDATRFWRPGRNTTPLWGDFTALRMRHLRRLGVTPPDVLVGGTPCQAFSVAGLRKSLGDARGNLTLSFVRLANAIDHARSILGLPPIIIVWENVPGVYSTKDNAFGCFLGALVGADAAIALRRGQRWTDAGLVAGPQRSAAWIVRDSQYFGLAQRRERVFVVASAREGFDPSSVLFEPDRVRRYSPPRREARQDAAGDASERSGGRGAGRDLTPEVAGTLVNSGRASGSATTQDAKAGLLIAEPIAFDTTQITHPENRSRPEPGNLAPTLAKGGHAPAIAFTCKDSGRDASEEISPTLRAMTHADSHANGGGQVAVAFALRGREGGAMPEVEGAGDTVGTLRAADGGSSRDYLAIPLRTAGASTSHGAGIGADGDPSLTLDTDGSAGVATLAAVRRLTERECERLQGYPDDYTLIPYRGRPAQDCPAGPRYKALGNSMSVPVMAWLGERIALELAR